MYFPFHSIQHQVVPNSVILLPKIANDKIYAEKHKRKFPTLIGNMHYYLIAESEDFIAAERNIKLWFSHVVYSGLLKFDLPSTKYHINVGLDLKTFYQGSSVPSIRSQKTLKYINNGKIESKFIELSGIQAYPNIYATTVYLSQRFLDQPFLVLHLKINSFEGMFYVPGIPHTKQVYTIGNAFEKTDSPNEKNFAQPLGSLQKRYFNLLVKKAGKLLEQKEDGPIYVIKDSNVEDGFLTSFVEHFKDKNVIVIEEHPNNIASIGLFLLNQSLIIEENHTTFGISSAQDQTFFTGPIIK
jgi:hypothetical protein